MKGFCISGVTVFESNRDVVPHSVCLSVGCPWLCSVCNTFCLMCTCASCMSSLQNSTIQQNIRATLITPFSHPKQSILDTACSLPHIPSGMRISLHFSLSFTVFISPSPSFHISSFLSLLGFV
ncbi:hypothetical protein GOODEAATRI_001088 [Goodea atripinnis]|uniref:Uncharacterized protein n=1 Tax=Goodea atripinnis TaxID=208336 RepID=A0ABV0PUA1_9TELE